MGFKESKIKSEFNKFKAIGAVSWVFLPDHPTSQLTQNVFLNFCVKPKVLG